MTATVFQFGGFELDCERFELRRNGRPVRLERKPLELLILLAEADGRLVTRAEIASRLWGDEVFVDTEHGINTAIRKIRQTLGDNPDHPRFLQTVTGKGYRILGVVPSITPPQPGAPFSPTTNPGAPSSPAASSPAKVGLPRNLWLTFAGLAALAILLLTVTLAHRRAHPAKPHITSLAVLPLDNLSGDPAQDYLADGMTDELTTMLAKDSNLRVISRTSVMQYKHARLPLPEIARRLHVDGILEGSLARTGDHLHMTVQLIHAPTDTHLWAESYDRNSDDAVILPQRIASTIAAETHSTHAPSVSQRYVNPAAHDAYLQGRYLWLNNKNEAALPWFQKALALQPDYPRGWCGLAGYYALGTMEETLDPRTSLALLDRTTQKCLQLDDLSSDSLITLAADDFLGKWNPRAALQEASHAIQLEPGASQSYYLRGWILATLNRHDEAIQSNREGLEIDPAGGPEDLINALLHGRHYDAALTEVNRRLEQDPNDLSMQFDLAAIYRGKGMNKESMAALEKFYRAIAGAASAGALHNAFTHGGMNAAIEWQIRFTRALATRKYISPVDMAVLYAQLGDKDHTLALLNEGLQQHAPGLLWIQNDAAYDFLHSDLRYRAIVQKIGLPPAW